MTGMRSNTAFMMPPDPIRNQGYLDTLRHTPEKNDPEAPPPKKPGEKYVIGIALLGMLVGATAAALISFRFASPGALVFFILGGIIIGGIAGVLIGDAIKNRRFDRHQPG
jgi:hypothetical protein